ncbi:hypothetical protein [Shewanella sp. Isolate11]|uniref:hypothetical protein n=1 Tax=Shewanella sp. Isolate11 TaxID=2908530 RepID=UPI001EFE009C|nr:hypothetical protein [Shewanella sp. Isolate11]MCG9695545.1 hypothetical protein [Shewanella sp. Isolate11]
MSKAVTAALLSAFICPGSGHFYLKRHNTGTLLSCISLTGLVYLLYYAVQQAQSVADRILSGELPLDMDLIYQQVTQTPAGSSALWINIATYAFVISWIVGIVDAYRIGKQQAEN